MSRAWAEMTWEEVRDAEPRRTVAILPIGAVEAHGPHLPLGTDVVIAEAMARAGADLLEERGVRTLVLPSAAYTAAPFGAAFPGTISVSGETVTALLLDVARALTGQGFQGLAIANAHLDPEHVRAVEDAAARAREEGLLAFVFPDVSKKPWAPRLGEEFRSGACHAGRYEGSVVLAERPELVRERERASLPANPASLSRAIRAGARTFVEAGGPRAYFGWPADATAEEGRATVSLLGAILAEAVAEALSGRGSGAAT